MWSGLFLILLGLLILIEPRILVAFISAFLVASGMTLVFLHWKLRKPQGDRRLKDCGNGRRDRARVSADARRRGGARGSALIFPGYRLSRRRSRASRRVSISTPTTRLRMGSTRWH